MFFVVVGKKKVHENEWIFKVLTGAISTHFFDIYLELAYVHQTESSVHYAYTREAVGEAQSLKGEKLSHFFYSIFI